MYCDNDTLACRIPGFQIISNASGIVNVMSVIVPAAPRLLVLGFVEAIIIAQ